MYPFHGISNTVLFTCRNSTTQWNIIHESVYGYGLHRLEVSSCRECKHQPDSRFILSLYTFKRQEAHLSQRDRATLRVTECFAKSLKVIRNDTLQFSVWSPHQFAIKTMSISYHFWDRDLQIGVRGRSRSLKMTPLDKSYTTYYNGLPL